MKRRIHSLDQRADVLPVRPAQGIGVMAVLSGENCRQTTAGLGHGVHQPPDAVRPHGRLEQQHIALSRLLLGHGFKYGFFQLNAAELQIG